MIKPTCFYLNEATVGDNKFMQRTKESKQVTTRKAVKEFEKMVLNLKKHKIQVKEY